MRRGLNYLLYFVALAPSLVAAQPILTATGINPVAGDHYTLFYGDSVSPGNPGANQTWDLSMMVLSYEDSLSFGSVNSAPGSGQFPNAANIQGNDGFSYDFYHASSTAFQYVGSGTSLNTVPSICGDFLDILHFPFSMGSSFTDTWSEVSGSQISSWGTATVTYDGYGTLKTPDAVYSNVVRVHTLIKGTEINNISTPSYTDTYIEDEYSWYKNNSHWPLVGLNMVYINGSSAGQTAYYTANANIATAIETNASGPVKRLSVFPNPAYSRAYITLGGISITAVSLFDEYGHLVFTQPFDGSPPGAPVSVSLEGLAADIYMARVTAANGETYTQKLSVLK